MGDIEVFRKTFSNQGLNASKWINEIDDNNNINKLNNLSVLLKKLLGNLDR